MDATTDKIIRLTSGFYEQNAASFSATRSKAWTGWKRVLDHLGPGRISGPLLDAACGNLRFEAALEQAGCTPAEAFAVDGCAELLASPAPASMTTHCIHADLIRLADTGGSFADLGIPPCALTVCFGFMHHVPTHPLRERLLSMLLSSTRTGGLCALSFWQYARDARLSARADAITAQVRKAHDLTLPDEGDAFLGWQDQESAFRFCHAFSDPEVDDLRAFAESLGAEVVDGFNADGKAGDLNRYLVLRAT